MIDIYSSPMEQYRAKKNNQLDNTTESVYDDGKKKRTRSKVRNTLDELPSDERTQVAANIYATKLRQMADIFEKLAYDAEEKHYFPSDLSEQKELILAAEGFKQYLGPLYNNKVLVDWVSSFDIIAQRYCRDNHFSELPEFVREIRYEIYSNGDVKNVYPHTEDHILGGSIINRINKIIMISDCIPFMHKLFVNNRKTRYVQQIKRDEKKYKG